MTTLAAFIDPPSLQQWILIGLLGASLLVIAVQSRRRQREPGPGRPSALERAESALERAAAREADHSSRGPVAPREGDSSRQVHQDFEQLLVELEQLSERITLQVEEEFGRLQGLMTEADRRISALRVLIEASRQLREPSREAEAAASQRGSQSASMEHTSVRSERALTPSMTIPPLEGGLEGDPRFAPIFQLADAGFAPRDIAQKLGESVGTVELVLNLRNPSQRSFT